MPTPQGYLKLSDEEFLRQMLAGENAAEPSAFASLSGGSPPTTSLPSQENEGWVSLGPSNPEVWKRKKITGPGYEFEAPGGYAESFAEPGSTPEQDAALRAGANTRKGPRGNTIYTQSYGQIPPDTPMSIIIAQIEATKRRKQQREAVEAEIAREASTSVPTKGRLAELQAALAAMGQYDVLSKFLGEEGGPTPAPGAPTTNQPATTTSIGPTGKVSISRRVGGGGAERVPLGEFSVEYARALQTGKALGHTGPDLDTYVRSHMENYRRRQAAGTAAGPLAAAPEGTTPPGKSITAKIAQEKAAGAPIPVGERQDISQMSNLMTISKRLATNLPQYQQFTGPVRGRAGWVTETFGGTLGVPESTPMELAFRTDVQDMNNRLVYMLSGKQINESEYQRLKRTMPDPNLPYMTNRVRIERFNRELNAVYQKRLRLQTAPAGDVSAVGEAPRVRNIDSRTGRLE